MFSSSTIVALAGNVFGLCVRWGFPALKPILKTKFNYMTELDLKNHSPNDAKPVLPAVFNQ